MDSSTHLKIYHLALVLGLSQSRVKGMMESPTFLDDVIYSCMAPEGGPGVQEGGANMGELGEGLPRLEKIIHH